MDNNKFLQTYIANLAEQLKSVTLEKTMLLTQLALAKEEIEELKKQIPQNNENENYNQPKPEENNGQWQS